MNNTIVLRKDGSFRVLITEYTSDNFRQFTQYLEVSVNNWDYDKNDNYKPVIKDFSYRLLTSPTDTLARWISRDSGFSNASQYVSIESIEQAEYILKNYINVIIPDKLECGKNHAAYNEMVLEMNHYNLPSCYESDFYYHDVLSLSNSPDKFIWILRDGGTHFITCKNDWNRATLKYKHMNPHFYIWNDGELMECDKNHAIDFYNLNLD